jgi:hypothetical protein
MNSVNIQNLPVKQQPDFYVFNDETNQKNIDNNKKYNKNFKEPLIDYYDHKDSENNYDMPLHKTL